jgi:hypothetical protein
MTRRRSPAQSQSPARSLAIVPLSYFATQTWAGIGQSGRRAARLTESELALRIAGQSKPSSLTGLAADAWPGNFLKLAQPKAQAKHPLSTQLSSGKAMSQSFAPSIYHLCRRAKTVSDIHNADNVRLIHPDNTLSARTQRRRIERQPGDQEQPTPATQYAERWCVRRLISAPQKRLPIHKSGLKTPKSGS